MQFKDIYRNLLRKQEQERLSLLEKHLRDTKDLVFKENDCLQEIGTNNCFLVVDWKMDGSRPIEDGYMPAIYYEGYDLKANGEADKSKLKRLDGRIAKERFAKVEPTNNLNIGFTYLLRVVGTNFYKIGVALDVEARVGQLQMGSPFDISIIAVKENLHPRRLEKTIHHKYKEKRKRGEWFEFDEHEVDRLIEEFFS